MKVLAFALALAVMPVAVQAASDAEEFKRAGMFGEWAEDCSRPPSPANPHYLTQGATDGSVVDSGWVKDDQRLEYVSEYRRPATYAPVRAIVVIEGNRRRVMEATNLNGEVLIRQGKLKDGRATPWFQRCVPGYL